MSNERIYEADSCQLNPSPVPAKGSLTVFAISRNLHIEYGNREGKFLEIRQKSASNERIYEAESCQLDPSLRLSHKRGYLAPHIITPPLRIITFREDRIHPTGAPTG